MMAVDLLNRRLSYVGAFFAFAAVVLGVIALATNYWTMMGVRTPSTAIATVNGTHLVGENIDWTWRVSFYLLLLNCLDTKLIP